MPVHLLYYTTSGDSTENDLQGLVNRRRGLPTVVMSNQNGGFTVYSLTTYCESCLSDNLGEYEKHKTPSGNITTSEFKEQVVKFAVEHHWTVYALKRENLAPRGFPNLALVRDDRLILTKVQGDVSTRVRLRSPDPLAKTLLISPEVPEEIRRLLLENNKEERSSDDVKFLYMDEKYSEPKVSSELQVTSLTGLLIPADKYPQFRSRFLGTSPYFREGPQGFGIEIHASDLFRSLPVEVHFEFYEGVVSLINDLDCRIYRRGFNFIPGHQLFIKHQRDLVGICFRSMLIAVQDYG